MGKNNIIGLVVGVIVGVFTAGIGYAAYAVTAAMVAFSVTSVLLSKNTANKSMGGSGIKDAVAADFEMASATEAAAIPVIFGTVRNPGNFLRYDKSTFEAVPIYDSYQQPAGGGKGGGGEPEMQTVTYVKGYDYYMSFDYGLCMGPVDRLKAVWDGQKMEVVSGAGEFTGDTVFAQVGNAEAKGHVRLYRGSETQTRVTGEPYDDAYGNYRGVCFASFQRFWIGQTNQPRSYLFELTRWPVCKLKNGSNAGIYARGSFNSADVEYYDANPAAIVFEILTNKVWGSGYDTDLIDVPSFQACADYYATNKIGLSCSLEAMDSLAEYIGSIQQHVGLFIVRDGTKQKAICMLDTANARLRDVITKESLIGTPKVSRPLYPTQTNELQVKFVNRHNGFKTEVVVKQDPAGIATAGRINSRSLTMNAYPSRIIAEAQSTRLLAELSYPQATIKFVVNKSLKARPGEIIQLEWDEYSDGNAVTFWRIHTITETNDGFEVEAAEDLYSTPYEGAAQAYSPLRPAFLDGEFNDDEDLVLEQPLEEPEPLLPVFAVEQNIWMARDRNAVVAVTKNGRNGHLRTSWYVESAGFDRRFSGTNTGKVTTGYLRSNIDALDVGICRSEREFLIEFDNEDEAILAMASASKIQVNNDHFQNVLNGSGDLLFIGEEIFAVGRIEETATPNILKVSAYLRAAYGSTLNSHNSGSRLFFIGSWNRGFEIEVPEATPEASVSFIAKAVTSTREYSSEYAAEIQFKRKGTRPFAPSLYDVQKDGSNWTVRIRPRFHMDGAHSRPDFEQDLNSLLSALPSRYSYIARVYAGGVAVGETFAPSIVFEAEDGMDAQKGLVEFEVNVASGDEVRVWTLYNGKTSLEYVAAS